MWNGVCADWGLDAIRGCSVVILSAGGDFKAVAGKFHAVVLTHNPVKSQVLFV